MISKSAWNLQTNELLEKGYTQFKLQQNQELKALQQKLLNLSRERTKQSVERLEDIHQFLKPEELNDFRLAAISLINQDQDFRKSVVEQVQPFLTEILGQDLAVQKSLNLVLLAPNDLTSQLPLHTDTLTGHSPFELVLFIPLSVVIPDQNMFILPRKEIAKYRELDKVSITLQKKTEALRGSFDYLNLQPGEVFIFWHHIPHGNSENISQLTHWSLNLRFKNIFTPYGHKKLGDYFVPLTTSPFTDMIFEESSWKL